MGMKHTFGKQFWGMIVLIFILLTFAVASTFVTFYAMAEGQLESLGESNIRYETALIEKYLQKGMDVMRVTANTVEYMNRNGASQKEILDYLTIESEKETQEIDENFTGIYGYINGEYLDGVGWEPPADYDPKERDWYKEAMRGAGEPEIVAPYVDSQTHEVITSVTKLLSDGESVISLDIYLNEIQNLTENIHMDDMGYGFIVDETGTVVAHWDRSELGMVYPTDDEQAYMMEQIMANPSGSFRATQGGESCTFFTDTVMDSWHVVMVISNTKLFERLRNRMLIQGFLCIVVFAVIVIFCSVAYLKSAEHRRQEEKSRKELNRLNEVIIKALAYAIDAKDRYTSGHSQRVAKYSVEIARRMGKSEEEQQKIYYSALLHDVGKIRVPEALINKPGKLTEEEFDQIIPHPVCSYHIVRNIYQDPMIAFGAKFHHERYDGSGYPSGLAGDNIPEVARIIGIADSYDAMASNRSYRQALPQEKVRDEIIRGKGRQFDPEIADIMVQMIDEDKEYRMCQLYEPTRSILLIDDEEMALEMAQHILSKIPEYEIQCAMSYPEAEKILKEKKIDLVLLDLFLNGESGFDVFEKIRKEYDIPVAFMTAEKDLSSIEKSAMIGADDYVVKPIIPIALQETVHAILSGWS